MPRDAEGDDDKEESGTEGHPECLVWEPVGHCWTVEDETIHNDSLSQSTQSFLSGWVSVYGFNNIVDFNNTFSTVEMTHLYSEYSTNNITTLYFYENDLSKSNM